MVGRGAWGSQERRQGQLVPCWAGAPWPTAYFGDLSKHPGTLLIQPFSNRVIRLCCGPLKHNKQTPRMLPPIKRGSQYLTRGPVVRMGAPQEGKALGRSQGPCVTFISCPRSHTGILSCLDIWGQGTQMWRGLCLPGSVSHWLVCLNCSLPGPTQDGMWCPGRWGRQCL